MRTRFAASVAAVVAAVMLFDLTGIVEAQSGRCYLGGHLYNRNRQIARDGVIEAECPSRIPPPVGWTIHSAPFGNWGVHSLFGGKRDERQFAGWARHGDQLQWNSCTMHSKFRAPNPDYYNRPSGVGWWQETVLGEERVNSKWLHRGRRGQSCRARWDGQVFVFPNLEMQLYELDPWSRDSRTATLRYGTVRIRLRCSSTWICEGDTARMQQRSVTPASSRVSAEAYVLLRTARK